MRSIIKKYDIAHHFIQQANPHLADVNALLPGMKISIPSSSKVVRTSSLTGTSKVKQQRQKNPAQTDIPTIKTRKILYAHAHRRPMGETIAHDQQVSKTTSYSHEHEQVGPVISGICCHCHQPVYSLTPPL